MYIYIYIYIFTALISSGFRSHNAAHEGTISSACCNRDIGSVPFKIQ